MFLHLKDLRGQNNTVSRATRCLRAAGWAGQTQVSCRIYSDWTVRASIRGRVKRFLSLPNRPDWLWGTRTPPPLNEYRPFLTGLKRLELEAKHPPPSSIEIQNNKHAFFNLSPSYQVHGTEAFEKLTDNQLFKNLKRFIKQERHDLVYYTLEPNVRSSHPHTIFTANASSVHYRILLLFALFILLATCFGLGFAIRKMNQVKHVELRRSFHK